MEEAGNQAISDREIRGRGRRQEAGSKKQDS
jgi:hypothetical protein